MKYIGFSKNVIAWFKSYLSNREFKININTSYSSPSNLTFGVSQESILEPFLFLLYLNNLPQVAVSDSLLYASDDCIVFQHKNVTEIEKQVFQACVTGFLIINEVYISAKTTKLILFGTKNKLRNAKA